MEPTSWLGVPVITLEGKSHAARVGASLLTSAGLESWIAPDPESFSRIAQKWANAPEALAQLRAGLRHQVSQSKLTDAQSAAANFSAVLRSVLKR